MLEIARKLIITLNDEKIKYVYFKSTEHIEDAVNGKTDFDFLVYRKDAILFEQLLLKIGCKRFVPPKGSQYPGVNEWLGFDESTGKLIHLHVHYQLVTGAKGYKQYVLPWTQVILENAVNEMSVGMKIIHPALELIELYTRSILKASQHKLSLNETEVKEANHLRKQTSEEEVKRFLRFCFGEDFSLPEQLFFKENLSVSDARRIGLAIRSRTKYWKRSRTGGVFFRSKVFVFLQRVKRKVKRMIFCKDIFLMKEPACGGLMIAFVGADGSGKTTICAEIAQWLSWKMEVSTKSLGVGRNKKKLSYRVHNTLKNNLYKILKRKKTVGDDKRENIGNLAVSEKKTIRKYLRQKAWVSFAKEIRKDLFNLNAYRMSGGIVVLDRYPQLQVRGISDGLKVDDLYPRLQKKEYRYLKIVNEIKPDLVFKLQVPLEIAIKRRPEDKHSVLEEKIAVVEKLKFDTSKVIDIDASQDYQTEILKIKKIIWDNL